MFELMLGHGIPIPENPYAKAFRINILAGTTKNFRFRRRYAHLRLEMSNGQVVTIDDSFPSATVTTEVSVPGTVTWVDVYAKPIHTPRVPYFETLAGVQEYVSPWRLTGASQWDACSVEGIQINGYDVVSLPATLPTSLTTLEDFLTGARAFNQNISGWDVSRITNFRGAFQNCAAFNQPIGIWNVAKATDMSNMFGGCSKFNSSLANWNVSNVTSLTSMFRNCPAFNQNLNDWDVSKVTSLSQMFLSSGGYNQPMDKWNTSKVERMVQFMNGAASFNQNLSGWNVSSVIDHTAYDTGATSWIAANKPKFV